MDKTMQAAKWLYDSNRDFSTLKTEESRRRMQAVMVMAKIFFQANGQDVIKAPIAVHRGRVYLPMLEENWAELHRAAPKFDGDELHSLKTILRRFSYAPTAGLEKGLIEAQPFSRHANADRPVIIDMADIPEDFIKSMRAVKAQYKDADFNYKVIQVDGRNFFADPGFELVNGDYDELVRAMKEGLIEDDRLYRLARDEQGNLYAW